MDSLNVINNDFERFTNEIIVNKAIKMDLFQIGELLNHLSDESQNFLDKRDIKGVIDTRNYIAHGYIVLKNSELWNTIHNDLPKLIEQLEDLAD